MANKEIKQTTVEDVIAVLTGTSFFAFGIFSYNLQGFLQLELQGSQLLEHLTGVSFGVLFIVLIFLSIFLPG